MSALALNLHFVLRDLADERRFACASSSGKILEATKAFSSAILNNTDMPIKIPPSEHTVSVSLINAVNFGPALIERFMAPPVPGLKTFKSSPSLSFFIRHPSGQNAVFDLGIRKDYANYSASIASYIPTTNYDIQISRDVSEILQDGGIELESIKAVIWRWAVESF